MKPIFETVEDITIIESICENTKKKSLYLEGITLQADIVNQNKRLYPKQVLRESIGIYVKKYLNDNRAIGELNHPIENVHQINPDRISHKFISIIEDGNNFITKALVLDTTCGKQVRKLIEGNVKIGMSSRGFGKTNIKDDVIVVENLHLITAADIVIDPSAPHAFSQAVFENKEWIFENGELVQVDVEPIIDKTKKALDENKSDLVVDIFKEYLQMIKIF